MNITAYSLFSIPIDADHEFLPPLGLPLGGSHWQYPFTLPDSVDGHLFRNLDPTQQMASFPPPVGYFLSTFRPDTIQHFG